MTRTRVLIGARAGSKSGVEPNEALSAAVSAVESAPDELREATSINDAKVLLAPACKAYYTLAAASRRKALSEVERTVLLAKLFFVRTSLEKAISETLWRLGNSYSLGISAVPSLFGASAKQGVSIRYALASCVPTSLCGGRCYAHDGRDREIHHLFRGAINWHLGEMFEKEGAQGRKDILSAVLPHIRAAVGRAETEASDARRSGFIREPRIRFSHVGDMAATPEFANAIGREIKSINPDVSCVLYTRHPDAAFIDPSLFVINFSIDSDRDPRRHRAPPGSQLVCSAWGGVPSQAAVVNFLEHHVERVANPTAASTVCPAITADEGTASSCDAVRCDKCFRRNDLISPTSLKRTSANARNELPLPGRGEAEQ